MTESHSNGLSALLTVSRSAAVCVPLITECIDYPGPPRVPIMSPDTSDTLPPPSAAVGGDHGDADCQAKCNRQHEDNVGSKRLPVPLKHRGFRKEVLRRRLGNGYCHTQDGTQRFFLTPIVEIDFA